MSAPAIQNGAPAPVARAPEGPGSAAPTAPRPTAPRPTASAPKTNTPTAIALFPGWALCACTLDPLARALEDVLPGAEIRVHDLHEGPHPDHLSGAPVSDETAARVAPGAWLVGWSQGGQAAAHLAARRGAACPGLVTLGSNPRFTASTDWTAAMPVDTFNAFCEGFRTNPDLTLSRFHALCTKGGPGGRALARSLGETRPDRAACQARLALLGTQDARQDLVAYRGPQLHLYGSADALVPASVARDLAVLVPEATVEMIDGGSHAFALEDPAAVARRVAAFIREHTAP